MQLLLCQLVGELIAHLFALPIPGAVIGMVLLFIMLIVKGEVSHHLKTDASGLLQHLSLLFVPAGVGIMVHIHRVAAELFPIAMAIIVSTFLGMAVTAGVFLFLLNLTNKKRQS